MVAVVNDRKISKESTVDHSEHSKGLSNLDQSLSSRTLSHRRSRVGSKMLHLQNLSNDVENEVFEHDEVLETVMPMEPRCCPISLNVVLPTEELLSVNVDTFPKMTIQDLLIEGLHIINRQLDNRKANYRFDFQRVVLFTVKPSKKTGYPKEDFPILDKKSNVFGTGINSFSLIYDKKDIIELKKNGKCMDCLIF
jgi:hypothetical protein